MKILGPHTWRHVCQPKDGGGPLESFGGDGRGDGYGSGPGDGCGDGFPDYHYDDGEGDGFGHESFAQVGIERPNASY